MSCFLRYDSFLTNSIAAIFAAIIDGGKAVEYIKLLHEFIRYSTISFEHATYPPKLPNAFENVPIIRSIFLLSPNSSTTPDPPNPNMPVAWASSTIMLQL